MTSIKDDTQKIQNVDACGMDMHASLNGDLYNVANEMISIFGCTILGTWYGPEITVKQAGAEMC